MASYFFDTSGIVKRYVQETGTPWVQNLTQPVAGHAVFLARLTGVELIAAVTRRERGGALTAAEAGAIRAQFRQDLSVEYRILEVTPALFTSAMDLAEAHGLRAADAIQLAVAAELHRLRQAAGLSRLTLVSSDQELNGAALVCGLLVDDPNLHP